MVDKRDNPGNVMFFLHRVPILWCPKVHVATQEARRRLFLFFTALLSGIIAKAFQASEIEKANTCRWKQGSDKCLLCFVDSCASVWLHILVQKEKGKKYWALGWQAKTPNAFAHTGEWIARLRKKYFMKKLVCTTRNTRELHCNQRFRGAKFYF